MVGYTVKTTNVCFMTGQSAYYDDDVENADAYGMIDGRSKRCLTWLGWTDDAQSIQRAWCSSAAFRGQQSPAATMRLIADTLRESSPAPRCMEAGHVRRSTYAPYLVVVYRVAQHQPTASLAARPSRECAAATAMLSSEATDDHRRRLPPQLNSSDIISVSVLI